MHNLRIMKVKREILSHAIQRLYEAEGKISKGELKSLTNSYKERMVQVKNTIQNDQSVLALYDLERIQTDLMHACVLQQLKRAKLIRGSRKYEQR